MRSMALICMICLSLGFLLHTLPAFGAVLPVLDRILRESVYESRWGWGLMEMLGNLLLYGPMVAFFGMVALGRGSGIAPPSSASLPMGGGAASNLPPAVPGVPPLGPTGLADPTAPVGIGGWLILPAIGLILGVLANLVMLGINAAFIGGAGGYRRPSDDSMAGYEMLTSLAMTAFIIVVAVKFFGRKASAPRLMIALYTVGLGRVVLGVLVDQAIMNEISPQRIQAVVVSLIACSIWIPYFLKSRRVKATFVNP